MVDGGGLPTAFLYFRQMNCGKNCVIFTSNKCLFVLPKICNKFCDHTDDFRVGYYKYFQLILIFITSYSSVTHYKRVVYLCAFCLFVDLKNIFLLIISLASLTRKTKFVSYIILYYKSNFILASFKNYETFSLFAKTDSDTRQLYI